MSALSAVGYALAAVATLGGIAVLIVTGWIVTRSGVVKGLKEASDGWEKRADLLSANLADCHAAATSAAVLAAEHAVIVAEQHRAEITEVRAELAAARERIAVLERATDLTTVHEALAAQDAHAIVVREALGRQAETVREALAEQSSTVATALSDVFAEVSATALERFEKVTGALDLIVERLDSHE